jgi:3-(3-hydroxy-phenyl)propionate hydroxylase
VTGIRQDVNAVTLDLESAQGEKREIRARYVVAADGGNSVIRRALGVEFEGRTKANQWIVVDVRNDPLGTPHIDMCCDPERPYVSAALPHGIRRFEFMVMAGETEEELSKPENLAKLMRKVVPDPEKVDYIRKRVYTHNARLAATFRVDRVLLAGDAAHIMPVWQGQGYNSGMRDACNLAWKLALVVKNLTNDALLDSYGDERRAHARSMIHLSEVAGDIFAPESKLAGKVRDKLMLAMNAVPSVKRYFAEMRFKPMPRYEKGVVVLPVQREARPVLGGLLQPSGATPFGRFIGLLADNKESVVGRFLSGVKEPLVTPVGRLFIQPRVSTEGGATVRLDDTIGLNFAILAWGTDPTFGMSDEVRAFWVRLGTRFISVKPQVQMAFQDDGRPGVVTLGDTQGRIKDWFGKQRKSVVFLRPDRFVAAICSPQEINETSSELALLLAAPLGA